MDVLECVINTIQYKTVTMVQCNYREQYGKQPLPEQISGVVKEILGDRESATTAER
jgi:hypothetical protein